ncbi:SRPBCC family protein [Actinomycetes bacterium KLBMP 9797]
MRLDHSFTVPVKVEEAWEVLLDVPRVAPCMPGATLTDFDGDSFAGTVKVKVGPIVLTYSGKGRFVERDEAARRVVVEASGRDTRSAGTAAATVTATLTPDGEATRVEVATDLTITGRPAQFGRGMLADVSGRLIGQFADCLADKIATPAPEPEPSMIKASPTSLEQHEGRPDHEEALPADVELGAEPIDLLRVSAGTRAVRAAGLVALGGLAAVATWLIVRALRR